jgi:DNA-binding LacI/PurR family transcriptional regulator
VIAGRDPDDADARFTVDNDHVASTRDCFDHMLQQGGVKRPALFAAKLDDTYTGDCLRAYRDWASEHGFEEALEVVPIAQGPMEAQVRAALSSPTRPDAVYANTEWLGTMTQRVCNELGLRVPEDVMIVACSDLGDLGFGGQRLTTLRVFPERIGKEAVELLIARIADPLIAETRKHIPTQLCPADTTNRRGAH